MKTNKKLITSIFCKKAVKWLVPRYFYFKIVENSVKAMS